MTEQKELKQDSLAVSYDKWRTEDFIAKIFFQYLKFKKDECFNNLRYLYHSTSSGQDKLIQLGANAACIEMFISMLEMDGETFKNWVEFSQQEKK